MQGKTINGFTLQRLLGVGGMAEVWYAENEIGLKAAVKILAEKLSHDDQMRERFLNEAKVMVQLDHPNIRRVYGYGNIDGRPTIIMEYLEGSDLKARLKQGQHFSQEELSKWWNQLVDALDYTHSLDIVHRDIKPSNIFIDQRGNAKLLDFGIAKVADTTTGTLTGSTLGTRIYMSPEQVKDPKRVGPASDSYSLAVTFVHLLTGKAPYDNSISSDYDIQESIVRKPVDLGNVPADWQGFLSPYLEKDPTKRPALKPFETEGIMKTTKTTETAGAIGGIKTTGTTKTTDDEGTLVDVPPVKAEPVKPESKKPETKNPKKTEPKPGAKTESKQDNKKNNDNNPDKPKSKKWLWIGLGIAAVVALALLLLPKPKDTSVKQPTKSDEEGQVEFLFGIADGHQFVDLDLPSGTMWATCNVGADKPEDYGNYYAWGETTTKRTYNWDTYKYANGNWNKLTKYCNKSDYGNNGFTDNLTTLQSGDDPAPANWGSGWRTPTKAQWDELLNNTTSQWTTQNGVKGRLFTSKKNGQSLFLPAAGYRWGGELYSTGSYGYYWSRSLGTDGPSYAWLLNFGSDGCGVSSNLRRLDGFSVRPVREK